MVDKHRPEVNLEISSGCFRIATKELIYNLCIIPNRSGLPIVERIVEGEKQAESAGISGSFDPYSQQISQETLRSLVDLCRDLVDFEKNMKISKRNGADLHNITQARFLLADLKEFVAKSGPAPRIEDGDLNGSGSGNKEFVDRIHALDQVLECALPVAEKEPAVSQDFIVFRKRLLEVVLTLSGEIRMKKEDETLAVDKAWKHAAAEAASKVAAVRSPQEMEQLLGELDL